MNETLQAIKAGLEKVEAIEKRRAQLESERAELATKIERLTAEVGSGNAKLVPDLTIAKARLESGLLNDLARCDREFNDSANELRGALAGIYPAIAQACGREQTRLTEKVQGFLNEILDSREFTHFCEETTRTVVNNSRSMRDLEAMRSFFGSPITVNSASANNVISRAKNAVEALKNVL